MSMTTVEQPTSNAAWQCRLAMAISHPGGPGAVADRKLLFNRNVLPIQVMQPRTQKEPDYKNSAYFSLFQDKLKMLCQPPVPASDRFFCSTTTVNAPGASWHCPRLEFRLQTVLAPSGAACVF